MIYLYNMNLQEQISKMKTMMGVMVEEKNIIPSRQENIKDSGTKESCDSGDCVNGTGKKTSSFTIAGKTITDVYEGQFIDGKYLEGKLETKMGDTTTVSIGKFKNDKLEGNGTQTIEWPKGKRLYEGNFSDGSMTSGDAELTFYRDSETWVAKVYSNKVSGRNSDFYDAKLSFGYGQTYRGVVVDEGKDIQLSGYGSIEGEDPSDESNKIWTHYLIDFHTELYGKPSEQ